MRVNNFNSPASAPILNSSSAQNMIMQFAANASQHSSSGSNLANGVNLLMMNNSNPGGGNNNSQSNPNMSQQFANANMMQQQQQQQQSSSAAGGKMWSNFGSTKDNRKDLN